MQTFSGSRRALHIALIMVLATVLGGCEVIGKIFETGVVVGLIVAVVVLAVLFWLIGKFRGR